MTYRAVRMRRDMILESDEQLEISADDTDAAADFACRSKISWRSTRTDSGAVIPSRTALPCDSRTVSRMSPSITISSPRRRVRTNMRVSPFGTALGIVEEWMRLTELFVIESSLMSFRW